MHTAATSASSSDTAAVPRAWWREPYVWLVIGGPLVVVVAGVITAFIAMSNPDPVLQRSPLQTATEPADMRAPADGDAPGASSLTMAPAQQARNHAATAELPAGK